MAQAAKNEWTHVKPDQTTMLESGLSALGMGNTAIQAVLTGWSSYQTAVRDVKMFYDEQQQFTKIREFLKMEGEVFSKVKIQEVLQEKLQENEDETVAFLDRICSTFNPFTLDQSTINQVNAAAEQKLAEGEHFRQQVEAFQEQVTVLTERYGDAEAKQRRANELLTDGYVMELALLGLVVSFMTTVSAYQTHGKRVAERASIENELAEFERNTLQPILTEYEETGRAGLKRLIRAQVKLENLGKKIDSRIEEAWQQTQSLGMTSLLTGINAMTNVVRFFTIGQDAGTTVKVMQGALATGQTLVAVGSGYVALQFYGSIEDWKALKEDVEEKLALVNRLLDDVDVGAPGAA